MTMTGRTLREYLLMEGGVVALCHFRAHLGPDSKTVQASSGETIGAFASRLKTNALIADVYDAVASLNANVVQANSRHKVKRPKPYPRPWADIGQKIGRDPIPVSQFASWWAAKGREKEDRARR